MTARERWARGIATLIFAIAVIVTLRLAFSMEGNMPMPGGWSMTMMWMVMPGQTWWGAAGTFLFMWQAMMIAMMLPSSWPVLELYQRVALSTKSPRPSLAAIVLGVGYFGVWLAFGLLSFGVGFLISRAAMASVHVSARLPAAAGAALMLAGVYQLTPLKQACLRQCRSPLLVLGEAWRPGLMPALKTGLKHGAYCAACCWALMLIQLVLGVMNLGVMIAVAATIGFEKLWKYGPVVARLIGVGAFAFGVYVLAEAIRW